MSIVRRFCNLQLTYRLFNTASFLKGHPIRLLLELAHVSNQRVDLSL